MKAFLLTLTLISTSAYAVNDCRYLKVGEKQNLKLASCSAIAKLHEDAKTDKFDVNKCLARGKFNICENMDFGATGTNIEVSNLIDYFGNTFACEMDVTNQGTIINVDCNGNY